MKKNLKTFNGVTKELTKLIKNNHDVQFIGSIMVFDKKGFVVDDIILGHGIKELLLYNSKETIKELNKVKKDFVNW